MVDSYFFETRTMLKNFSNFLLIFFILAFASVQAQPVTDDERLRSQIFLLVAGMSKEAVGTPTLSLADAAKNGDRSAQWALGALHVAGLPPEFARSKEKAVFWFSKSAEQGFLPAFAGLAATEMCFEDKSANAVRRSKNYFARSIDYFESSNATAWFIATDFSSRPPALQQALVLAQRAEKDLELWLFFKAVALPEIHHTMAVIYSRLGQFSQGMVFAQKAIEGLREQMKVSSANAARDLARLETFEKTLLANKSNKAIYPGIRTVFQACDV